MPCSRTHYTEPPVRLKAESAPHPFDFKSSTLPLHSRNSTLNRIRQHTVKPVFYSGHFKIDKTEILKTNGNLMKVESIDLH